MATRILTVAGTHSSRAALAATVFAMGALMAFVAGFAHPHALHDAAHDTRHALAFPCH